MTETDLDATHRLLQERLLELQGRIDGLAKAPERGSTVGFGKRIGDGTTEAIGRLTEIGVGESLEATRDRVQAALSRIADGTYGTCASCGKPIAALRLQAAPESIHCIDCARSLPRR